MKHLVVILLISGLQVSLFGFLGTQLVRIHRELFRIQRENKQLSQQLALRCPRDAPPETPPQDTTPETTS